MFFQSVLIICGSLSHPDRHRARLAEDHANARALAEGLARLPGLELDPTTVKTNMVMFSMRTIPAAALASELDHAGVRVLALGPDTIRAVTNLMVSEADIPMAVEIIGRTMRKLTRRQSSPA